MGFLVYCPTCGGKMSDNAKACPHCGETDFFELRPAGQAVECTCPKCNGKKFSYRYKFYGHSYNPNLPLAKNEFTLKLDELKGGYATFKMQQAEPTRAQLQSFIKLRSYRFKVNGFEDYELEVGRFNCYWCGGSGVVRERGNEWVDMRKPVD